MNLRQGNYITNAWTIPFQHTFEGLHAWSRVYYSGGNKTLNICQESVYTMQMENKTELDNKMPS